MGVRGTCTPPSRWGFCTPTFKYVTLPAAPARLGPRYFSGGVGGGGNPLGMPPPPSPVERLFKPSQNRSACRSLLGMPIDFADVMSDDGYSQLHAMNASVCLVHRERRTSKRSTRTCTSWRPLSKLSSNITKMTTKMTRKVKEKIQTQSQTMTRGINIITLFFMFDVWIINLYISPPGVI